MILVLHMLICGGRRIELELTRIACGFGRPMIECVHMLIGRFLIIKFFRASLAVDLRLPMANICHMLVRCVSRAEQLATCVALIPWGPVIRIVCVDCKRHEYQKPEYMFRIRASDDGYPYGWLVRLHT